MLREYHIVIDELLTSKLVACCDKVDNKFKKGLLVRWPLFGVDVCEQNWQRILQYLSARNNQRMSNYKKKIIMMAKFKLQVLYCLNGEGIILEADAALCRILPHRMEILESGERNS